MNESAFKSINQVIKVIIIYVNYGILLLMENTELYLIRHAESEMNTNPHLIGGRSNHTPLTVLGIMQAKNLGKHLLAEDILPDSVYSSPALRTLSTARYCLQSMGINQPITIDDRLQELGQGVSEGKPRDAIYTTQVMNDILRLGKDFKLDGGESMNDVARRMASWAETNIASKGGRHFAFTHGGAIKYWASSILDMSHLDTYRTEIDNASFSLFTHTGGQWKVAYLNHRALAPT